MLIQVLKVFLLNIMFKMSKLYVPKLNTDLLKHSIIASGVISLEALSIHIHLTTSKQLRSLLLRKQSLQLKSIEGNIFRSWFLLVFMYFYYILSQSLSFRWGYFLARTESSHLITLSRKVKAHYFSQPQSLLCIVITKKVSVS